MLTTGHIPNLGITRPGASTSLLPGSVSQTWPHCYTHALDNRPRREAEVEALYSVQKVISFLWSTSLYVRADSWVRHQLNNATVGQCRLKDVLTRKVLLVTTPLFCIVQQFHCSVTQCHVLLTNRLPSSLL